MSPHQGPKVSMVCYELFARSALLERQIDVSPEFHSSPVPGGPSRRQICYRHLSRGVDVCVGQASGRSRDRQTKTDSFGDIINWGTKKHGDYHPCHRSVGVSQATSHRSHRQAMTHLMNGCDTYDHRPIPVWFSPTAPGRFRPRPISGLHSTGRRSLSLPVHFGLALSDWKGPA
jgi:hypothetical protein